jgi:hypothetical protein
MQDWQQWHSPFRQAPSPVPRLKPNPFARLVRSVLRFPVQVLAVWGAIVGLSLALTLLLFPQGHDLPDARAIPSVHADRLAELERQFPNLDGLITIHLTSADAASRQTAQTRIARALEAETSLFHVVLMPGQGPYYERNALLYLSADDIAQRVATATALAPLFRAIAAKPSVGGLNILLREVTAAVEQGRQPQGLDRLFRAAGASIRSQVAGNPAELDWREVAGLSFQPGASEALVIAWPLPDQNAAAAQRVRRELAQAAPPGGVVTTRVEGLPVVPERLGDLTPLQWITGLGMALAFVAATFLVLFGELRLVALVSLPVLAALAPALLLAALIWPPAPRDLWLLPVIAGPVMLPLATHLAIAMVENDDGSRSAAGSWMLAAQRDGPRLAALTLALILFWAGWFTTGLAAMERLSVVLVTALSAALASVFTLGPVLLHTMQRFLPPMDPVVPPLRRWVPPWDWDGAWRRPLAVAAAVVAFVGLTLVPPVVFSSGEPAASAHSVAVQILADSPDAAESKIARLREVQGVKAVRWLGAFLPADVPDKLALLAPLRDVFPHANPATMAEMDMTAEEQFTALDVSLKAIANAPHTPAELSAAAQDFRRSLLLLGEQAHNPDVALLRLETLLFARFDQAATTANLLAGLEPPAVASLDSRLRDLFLSPEGIYRLSVEPVRGLSAAALAEKLEDFGLAPVDRALAAAKAALALRRLFFIAAGLGLMAAAAIILIVSRRIVSWSASMGSFAVGVMAAWSFLALSGVVITPQNLPALMTAIVMGFTLNMLPLIRSRALGQGSHFGAIKAEGAGILLVVLACAAPLFVVGSSTLHDTALVLVLPLLAFAAAEVLVRSSLAQELGVLAARLLRRR